MLTSNQDFRLVSFGQDEVSADVYGQAERVFLESIGSTARTNTNEIAYWKDRYNSQFGGSGDRLYIYGFLNGTEVIGFALVFFYARHNLVVVDHIAIREPSRHFGSFFYFKNMIAQHLMEQGHHIDFVLAEIVTSGGGDPHPVEPQLLIQLLKQSGFKVAHLEYFTPSIREAEYSSQIEAALMIFRNERANRIRATELFALLDCLLTDLYLRWYSPHSTNLRGFRQQLQRLRAAYKKQLSRETFIELNGNWTERHTRPDQGAERELAEQNGLAKAAALLALVLVAAAALAGISYASGIAVYNVVLIFIAALFGLFTILAIWYRAAGQQAERVLRLLVKLVRRDKNVR